MTVNYGAKYGEWIPIDNDPEIEDTYLVAWLGKGGKRETCFIGIANFYDGEWDSDDLKHISDIALGHPEVELQAWTPLPEMYKVEWVN